MTKFQREALKFIKKQGFEIIDRRHGKHLVVRILYRGKVFSIPIPSTPSDWRTLHNFKSLINNLKERAANDN